MGCTCHRCGETLASQEFYCPHCGAPQLRIEPREPLLDESAEVESLPAQRAENLQWQVAIQAALMVAVPAALLSSLVSVGAIWVFAGGFLSVAIYRRRTAAATDGKLGWRIGGIMGLVAAALWMAAQGLTLVVDRFVLHKGASIDQQFRAALELALGNMAQQDPSFMKTFPWFTHFWLSPYGIAAMLLASSIVLALMMVFFAALGGSLGGRYLRTRVVRRAV